MGRVPEADCPQGFAKTLMSARLEGTMACTTCHGKVVDAIQNISFTLPSENLVRLEVFSLIGQRVATLVNDRRLAGTYTVTFDASHLPSGVYFYKLTAGTFMQTKQMTLIK
jgi:hypothetical protein